jgi:rRNA maturation endonuclease Nob1
MNEKDSKEQKYLIIDSTAVIHVMSKEDLSDKGIILVFPEDLKREMQSFQAEAIFETLKEDRIIFSEPSLQSTKKVKSIAEKTNDIASLSDLDLQVIAIALDFPNSTVISDDNAIQNVCFHLEIPIKSYSFRIQTAREYFWKCTVCYQKYKSKQDKCIECGSPTKRLYTKRSTSS